MNTFEAELATVHFAGGLGKSAIARLPRVMPPCHRAFIRLLDEQPALG